VALVAGGSSGIGLAVATELAREGAHVAIGARDRDRLELAARGLEAVAGGKVSARSVDITDRAASQRWVDDVAAEFGALHIVVISGGSPPVGSAAQFEFDDYQAAIEKILYPVVGLTLAALPYLKTAGWGRLLFVASETALVPIGPLVMSGVTRAPIVRFAQGLAADVGTGGITVNVLAPGSIRTPMMERAAAKLAGGRDVEEQLAAMGHHSALGRLARTDEIGAVGAFLASARASFITGGVHLIDGGASVVGPNLPHVSGATNSTYA